jgi:hypothetical protein
MNGPKATSALSPLLFSNRPFRVKRLQTFHRTASMSLTGSRFSSESALSPSSMGFEDEADQSLMDGLAVR